MILLINACVRKNSRTRRLADCLLGKLTAEKGNRTVEEVVLGDVDFPKVDEDFLNRRDELTERKDFSDPMFCLAKQFAGADTVVVAAPYWDLSFPAVLKQYFEQINVRGITFTYSEKGIPVPLCRAKELYYVSTSGGPFPEEAYGYGYVRRMAQMFYGIKETKFICAKGLDVEGNNAEKILQDAMNGLSD